MGAGVIREFSWKAVRIIGEERVWDKGMQRNVVWFSGSQSWLPLHLLRSFLKKMLFGPSLDGENQNTWEWIVVGGFRKLPKVMPTRIQGSEPLRSSV